ncbi:hypothetical protein BMS3Bbin02_00223 [bacterium BMS3Bbin02]|nr:hypothetical protein BMS3Bbin02_00223 [bacterium BMS3Bbin02]
MHDGEELVDLAGIEPLPTIGKRFGESLDGCEGRPELVTHHRHKLVLDLRGTSFGFQRLIVGGPSSMESNACRDEKQRDIDHQRSGHQPGKHVRRSPEHGVKGYQRNSPESRISNDGECSWWREEEERCRDRVENPGHDDCSVYAVEEETGARDCDIEYKRIDGAFAPVEAGEPIDSHDDSSSQSEPCSRATKDEDRD